MKRLLLFTLLLMPLSGVFAQTTEDDKEEKEAKKRADQPEFGRWYGGGNFGLQFGNPTMIDLSPIVGYRLTEKFSLGAGVTFRYWKFKYPNNYELKTNLYGGSLFARYQIFESFFLQVEDEALNGEYYDPNYIEPRRRWVNSVMVGGGLIQPLGSGGITIQGMYIVNYDETTSYYPTPFVLRMGFFF